MVALPSTIKPWAVIPPSARINTCAFGPETAGTRSANLTTEKAGLSKRAPLSCAAIAAIGMTAQPIMATGIAIAIPVAIIGWAVIPIAAIAAHDKGARFDKPAFSVVKFALLVPAVSGPNAQVFIRADGGITAHGLIVDGNATIHAAAAKKILHDIGDVVVLSPCAVLGANDLPTVILGARWGAREGHRRGNESRRKNKNCIASG